MHIIRNPKPIRNPETYPPARAACLPLPPPSAPPPRPPPATGAAPTPPPPAPSSDRRRPLRLLCASSVRRGSSRMASEDSKDMLKNVDWKTVGGLVTTESSQPVVKKRLPKKIRQVPECYFLPRRSLPSALAIYGAVCAAGVGAGMLLEVWINKKIKEDSDIIWEMGK